MRKILQCTTTFLRPAIFSNYIDDAVQEKAEYTYSLRKRHCKIKTLVIVNDALSTFTNIKNKFCYYYHCNNMFARKFYLELFLNVHFVAKIQG